MKIAVLGAGKMGTWLCDSLCEQHEVAVFDPDRSRLRYVFNTVRMTELEELTEFCPDLLINAVSLQHTRNAFEHTLPFLNDNCMLADIASVKNGLGQYYKSTGKRYVSVHPMFGPTFASLSELRRHHAIIIAESDEQGKYFFKDFFGNLGLQLHEYTFEEHDQTIAYSLSVPFASSLVFGMCMKQQDAPGTTFEKHLAIARGLLSEDDHLLSEILLNPFTLPQLERILHALENLKMAVQKHDKDELAQLFQNIRKELK